MKRLKNIEGKNEQQLEAIKDGHLNLANQISYKKPKLKSLRFLINKKDKEQVQSLTNLFNWSKLKLIMAVCTINQGIKIRILLILKNFEQRLIHLKELILQE